MTDTIPTRETPEVLAPVVDLKQRQKPGPKPKPKTGNVALAEVLVDIEIELALQYEKWGEQNHPIQGGVKPENARFYYEAQANGWKAINDQRVKDGVIGWDGILLEEVFEALAESDTDAAITELVQVAAVAVQAILALKRGAA